MTPNETRAFATLPNTCYIAGPMRGYPDYNRGAFDTARDYLESCGYGTVVPRDDDPAAVEADPSKMTVAMLEDLDAVARTEFTAVLDGWQRSEGASIEVAFARMLGKPVVYAAAPDMQVARQEGVLSEADRIVGGARSDEYGHPADDFARTAQMWTALFGREFTATEVGMAMIALKLSREAHGHKRDNCVDMSGYAKCIAVIEGDE